MIFLAELAFKSDRLLVCYNTVEALQAVSMLVRHLDSVGVKVVDEKWSIRFRITTVKLITERHNED